MDTAIQSAIGAQQSKLALQIQTAVAKLALDTQKTMGDAVNQMLADAAQQMAAASKAPGRGARFDATG